MKNLNGKWVWITGASAGIGRAISIEFAKRNSNLILSSRRKGELEKVAQECLGAQSVHIVPLDLNFPASLKNVYHEVEHLSDGVDILINNGGISQRDLASNTSMETCRRLMQINFFSAVELSKLVMPKMKLKGEGHIIAISSVAGKVGTPLRSSYCASKHALQGYFESLGFELEKFNIGVSIICPGYIKTDISKNALVGDGRLYSKMDKNQDQGISPQRVANEVIENILKNKKESYVGRKEILIIYIKRYWPWLFRKIVRNEFQDKF